jgi:hypothetical protein
LSSLAVPPQRFNGSEQKFQIELDEIDVGNRENDLALDNGTLIQDPVDEIEQRYLTLQVCAPKSLRSEGH